MGDPVTDLHVLVIGLDPFRVPGPWAPEPVAEAIEAGMQTLAARGCAAQSCLVGLDGSDDIEGRITDALQEQLWDCVVVGGGLRHDEGPLELFETVINLVRRHAPQAAIAFNSTPYDVADAVGRVLG